MGVGQLDRADDGPAHHVGCAVGEAELGVARRPHEHVVDPVAVDVAGGCDARAGPAPVRVVMVRVDVFALEHRFRRIQGYLALDVGAHDEGAPAAVARERRGSDHQVGHPIAVEVARERHGRPRLGVASMATDARVGLGQAHDVVHRPPDDVCRAAVVLDAALTGHPHQEVVVAVAVDVPGARQAPSQPPL